MTSIMVGLKADKAEIAKLKQVFAVIDTNHDGYLSQEEI